MSTRRTRHSNKKKPNAAYYVGYVEDDETPEMIMRKFAELEKIRMRLKEEKAAEAKKKNDSKEDADIPLKSGKSEMSDGDEPLPMSDVDEPLSMKDLESVFRNTSMYSMNSLKRNNEIFFDKPMISEDGFTIGIEDADITGLRFEVDYEVCEEDMLDFFPQDDSDYTADEMTDDDEKHSFRRRRRVSGVRRRQKCAPNMKMVAGFGSKRRAETKKIVRLSHSIDRQKYPYFPVPRSWGMSVQPFQTKLEMSKMKNFVYEESDILSMKHEQYGRTYTGIIIDPPFDLSVHGIVDKSPGTISLKEFEQLPIPELMPSGGILYIWTPTELIPEMIKMCEKWSFVFVEHATWVTKDRRGGICNISTDCFTQCTNNLLLFRKIKDVNAGSRAYYQLYMLHQRTPDTFFDFVRYHPSTGQRLRSKFQYNMVEEMIWNFRIKDQINLLYLWAPKDEKRTGWHMVCDVKHQKFLAEMKAKEVNDDESYW